MKSKIIFIFSGFLIIALFIFFVFVIDLPSKIYFETSKKPTEREENKVERAEIENVKYVTSDYFLENEKLNQEKIYLKEKEIVTLNFKALDKDYEIFIEGYNLFHQIKKGETKIFQFQAVKGGSFDIICQNCRNKKIGVIIIENEI